MIDAEDFEVETRDSRFDVQVNEDNDVVLNLVSEYVGVDVDGDLYDQTSFAVLEPFQAVVLAADLIVNSAKGVIKSLF